MLATVLSVLEMAYVVAVISYIVLQKRSAVATLAWIMAFVAFPPGAFVFYVFVGPRRIHKNKLRKLRSRLRTRAELPAATSDPADPSTAHPQEMRERQLAKLGLRTGDAPSTCQRVTVLRNGVATYAAIEEAIRAAKHHVHLEYYIFDRDQTGTRMRDLLVETAKRGVEVRLLADAVGSNRCDRRFIAPLRDAGGRFAFFHRVGLVRWRPRLINFRTHRKIVVCDGRVGFTGGINITDTQNEEVSGRKAFRDTHVRLEGAAVRWLQIVFFEEWHYATGHSSPVADHFPDIERGSERVQIVSSGPDGESETIKNMYFAAIAASCERVYVTTPYFVPDEAILAALMTAAMRGVDVRLLAPRMSDSWLVTMAGRSYFDQLLGAGVRVFEYMPSMLHAKTLLVDRDFAAIGTANMDNRSFRLNFEVSAIVHGEATAAELARLFENDLESARELNPGVRGGIRFPERLAEAGARLLSPLL